jgi:hypothetical protein
VTDGYLGDKYVTVTSATSGTNNEIPADAMYALVDDVSVSGTEAILPVKTITFHHMFALLNWTLMVNPASQIHESIGRTEIGLYPRRTLALLKLGKVAMASDPNAISTADTWLGRGTSVNASTAQKGQFLHYDALGDDTKKETTLTQSLRFIPIPTSTVASTLVMNMLTFKTDIDTVTIYKKEYPIKYKSGSTEKAVVFQPGKQYNVTSKLTKAPFFKAKKILAITTGGPESIYAGAAGASNAFLTSVYNFSLNGVLPVNGGLTIASLPALTAENIGTGSSSEADDIVATLNTNPKPDIVIVGEDCYWDSVNVASKAILDYIDHGGVVIMLYAGGNIPEAVGGVWKATDYKMKFGGTVNGPGARYLMNGPEGDPIMTGTVGGVTYKFKTGSSLAGYYWGDDSEANTYVIEPGHSGDFVVYSSCDGAPIMVRYKKKNLFFVGGSGFLSGTIPSSNNNTSYPFATGSSPKYHANSKFMSGGYSGTGMGSGSGTTENAHIFGNIMAWAIYQAQYYGINTSNGLTGMPAE